MLNTYFIFSSLGFLVWIFFWNILFDFKYILYFLITISFLWFIILFFLKKYQKVFLFIISFIFLWLIYSSINNYEIKEKSNFLTPFYNKEITIIWINNDLYKKKNWQNSYIFSIESIENKKIKDIKFILEIPANFKIKEKEKFLIKTKITPLKQWSYKNFLLSRQIYFTIKVTSVLKLEDRKLNIFEEKIYLLRERILDSISQILPQKEAWLLSWILIWERNEMDQETLNNFNNAWLTHLIAISWFNITLIIVFLLFLLKIFPIFIKVIFITFFIISFTILVWAEAPVIRASIVWIIWYYILVSWRNSHSLSLLILAWIIMILYNPLYLNYDISFHLSFLAVFWLLYLQNFYEKIFFFLPKMLAIKESFVLTMSAMTTTLPVLIINFWYIWLLSPIANMLVWWVIPFVMIIWFINILINSISNFLWYYLWFLTYFILKYILFIWNFIWNLEIFVLKIDFWIFSPYIFILYILFLTFITIYIKTKND